jgi:hypothetical protein
MSTVHHVDGTQPMVDLLQSVRLRLNAGYVWCMLVVLVVLVVHLCNFQYRPPSENTCSYTFACCMFCMLHVYEHLFWYCSFMFEIHVQWRVGSILTLFFDLLDFQVWQCHWTISFFGKFFLFFCFFLIFLIRKDFCWFVTYFSTLYSLHLGISTFQQESFQTTKRRPTSAIRPCSGSRYVNVLYMLVVLVV